MQIPLNTLAFGLPGGMEYVVILIVALLVFGRRLPTVMRSVGGSMREFKKGLSEGMGDDEEQESDYPARKKQSNVAPGAVSRDRAEVERSESTEHTAEAEATHYQQNDDKQRSL